MSRGSTRAVFFDFGGTLFSYTDVWGRNFYPILLEAMQRLGVESETDRAGPAFRDATRETFVEFRDRAYYLHRDLYRSIFERFARILNGEATPEQLDWFHERQRDLVVEQFQLRSDCLAVLSSLRDSGLHVGIVSNIDDDYLVPMIARVDLAKFLDAWTSSEEARSCKPDPGIFEVALGKAGVEARDCFFVGDSEEHDIAGARALGMQTVLIQEGDLESPGSGLRAEAHHRIRTLSELLAIVEAHA